MAVAHDAVTEAHTGTTGHSGSASFSFSHNPVGTPRGVVVFVCTVSATKTVTSVTYDGVALTSLSVLAAVDTAGEPGRIDVFFLGSSVPVTDPATIVVNRTNNAVVMTAFAHTVTANTNTELPTALAVVQQEDGAIAATAVDDGSVGTDSLRLACAYTGAASPPAAGSGTTLGGSIDLGAFGFASGYETVPGQGSRTMGLTAGSDDRAYVLFAVRETPVLDQDAYRFRNDDGDEATATWRQPANTPDTIPLDTRFRARFAIEETAGVNPRDDVSYNLEYRRKPSGGSFGAWTPVDTLSARHVKPSDSPNVADGAATTRQIWPTSSGFAAGSFDDLSGSISGPSVSLGAAEKTELEWSVIIDSAAGAADADEIELRILARSATFETWGYTNTASLTVGAGAPPPALPPILVTARGSY